MKIIDRHIGWRVLSATIFGVAVLCFVLVLGNVLRELMDLMINRNLPLKSVILFMLLVLPFSLTFTIPWGFLTALLLVFGRMSADNELLTLRASGVSMVRLCMPVFLLALVLSGICFWLNIDAAPRAKQKMASTISDLAKSDPLALFTPDEVIDQDPDRLIYIGGKEGDKLTNIMIFEVDGESLPAGMIMAKEGRLSLDPQNDGLVFHLYHARFENRDKMDPSDVSKIREGMVMAEGAYRMSLDKLFEAARRGRPLSSYTLPELEKFLAEGAGGDTLKATVEYHRRFSVALASVAFVLVAVPLGITAHRKETSVGFGISLVLAFAYYVFILQAQVFGRNPAAHPVLLMWIPNVLFGIIGSILFIRLARR
jgi:lipopolysaccharide export system permease protein